MSHDTQEDFKKRDERGKNADLRRRKRDVTWQEGG